MALPPSDDFPATVNFVIKCKFCERNGEMRNWNVEWTGSKGEMSIRLSGMTLKCIAPKCTLILFHVREKSNVEFLSEEGMEKFEKYTVTKLFPTVNSMC